LIALGEEGESIGAARLHSDEETWMSKFRFLAGRARVILTIPASSDGTFFEIEWLKNNMLLEKTVFIMPPQTQLRTGEMLESWGRGGEQHGEKDYAEIWSLMQKRCERIGLRFPDYHQKGGLIEFKNDGALYAQCAFEEGSQVPSIKKALRARLQPTRITMPTR
jgi:hypothetical protein